MDWDTIVARGCCGRKVFCPQNWDRPLWQAVPVLFLPRHNLDTRILVEQVIPHSRSTARNVVQRPLANTPGPRTNFARFHIPFFITSGMGWDGSCLATPCSQPASSFVWEVNGEATPHPVSNSFRPGGLAGRLTFRSWTNCRISLSLLKRTPFIATGHYRPRNLDPSLQ